MTWLSCPNWSDFQHYKDRDPPWIKLHRQLLGNYEWSLLPDASKAHLVGIWLLAARHENKVPADPEWIGNQIGATEAVDIEVLLASGLLEPWKDGSAVGKREDWPSRYISPEVRKAVWARDGGKCRKCAKAKRLEYDHIIPVSKGGTGAVENIQLLCVPCNRKKRNHMQAAEQPATQGSGQKADLRSLEAETEAETERTDEGKEGSLPSASNGSSAWTPEQRAAAKGWRKASSDPRAFDAIVKQAAEERLVGGGFGWPVVGQALLEMRGTSGASFNLPYLLGCCRNIAARKPVTAPTMNVTDDFGRSVPCRETDGWWVSIASGERVAEVRRAG